MSDEEFNKAIERLRNGSDAERTQWIRANASSLSKGQLEQILVDSSIATPETSGVVREALTVSKAAEAGAAAADEALAAGGTQTQANAAGKAAAEAEGSASAYTDIDTLVPTKYLDALGIADPSPEQLQQFVDDVNAAKGSNFTSFDEIAAVPGLLKDPVVVAMGSLVATAEEVPEPSVTITLLNGKKETIVNQDAALAQQTWGLRDHELARTVKMASALGFDRLDGGVAWQPMAALFKAAGFAGYGQTAEQENATKNSKTQLAIEIQKLKDQRAKMDGGQAAAPGLDAAIAEKQAQYDGLKQTYSDNITKGPTSAKNPMWTAEYLARAYEAGIQKYEGDDRLAYIGVFDPALAEKLKASGGDITKMSWQDSEMLGSLTRAGGFSSLDEFAAGMNALGMGEATGFDQMSQLMKSLQAMLDAGAGGGGSTRMTPDPVQLRQSAKDMYMSLYLEEPDDKTLDSFAAQISASIANSPDTESVNVDARVREAIEADPKHAQYYGKKPSGMMDAEYQNMHRSAQQSMLGAELAGNQPTRIGMQQGDYQTTIGATMGTSEAWDNSTFMGRLAKAAQVVGRNT